jgi:hypothetical protein
VHRAAELIGIDGYRGGWLVVSADAALLALRFTVVEDLEPVIARVERGGAPARAPAISGRGGCWGGPRGPSVFPAPCRVEPELHVALRRPPGEELGEVLEDDPPIASFPAIAWPATRIFARVGRKKPARRLSSIVLPQPDWPSTQTDSEAPR